jgi:hypothetical protein
MWPQSYPDHNWQYFRSLFLNQTIFSSSLRLFSFPFAPRRDSAAVPILGIDEPKLGSLLPLISPKLVCFQTIVILLPGLDHMTGALRYRQSFLMLMFSISAVSLMPMPRTSGNKIFCAGNE